MEWGRVAQWVEVHFDEITNEIERVENTKKVFQTFAEHVPYSVDSMKKAYGRRRVKESAKDDPTAKVHGNRVMSTHEESILIGYLMMCSEISHAKTIDGLLHFSELLLGSAICRSTAYNIVNRNQYLLRPTKEKTMASA